MQRTLVRVIATTIAFTLVVAGQTSAARADFHLWKFAEIYSNASGTVQFIELSNVENGETLLGGQQLRSQGQTFTFPSDLPAGTPTENRRLLLATPGYFNSAACRRRITTWA